MRTSDAVVDTPLVVHLIYRFECGGLQALLAECINRMPAERFRHVVVCLSGHTDFAGRIGAGKVRFFSIDKLPGRGLAAHLKLYKLLRALRPAVVHTYNIGTVEYAVTAWLAGVPMRIHAEHGRDTLEMAGQHARYNLLRRLVAPVVDRYVAVSADLGAWLNETVGIPGKKIVMVTNGVDTIRYAPASTPPRQGPATLWIGAVGRIDRIKNHAGLLDAFWLLLTRFPPARFDLRLAIVGDGPLLAALRERVAATDWADRVWLPGARDDIPDIMRSLSVFVLPSLSEATPVTILEAMATALPVVASRVGGVPRLVVDGQTGSLVRSGDVDALAAAIARYVEAPALRARHGAAGRERVAAHYGIDAMVAGYDALYSRREHASLQHYAVLTE